MPRDRLVVVVIAAIALFALAAGAASLSDPAAIGDGSDGSGSDNSQAPTTPNQPGVDAPMDENNSPFAAATGELCVISVDFEVGLSVVVVLTALIAGLIWVRISRLAAVASVLGIAPIMVMIYAFLTLGCYEIAPDNESEAGIPGRNTSPPLEDEGGEAARQILELSTDPLIVLVGLAVIGVLVATVAMRGLDSDSDAVGPEEPTPATSSVEATELARIAGSTADRLAETDTADGALENEVYRAWRQMTAHLDVDAPATSTPGEFAVAAIDAGLDPDDVHALTTLFEEVRYGERPATPAREEAAIETLRRIERHYGEGDG